MKEKNVTTQDYPLSTRCPERIVTPTGKPLTDITLENVLAGNIGPQDVRISQQTLEYQAQIAGQMQRHAVARNFRRAAELISFPMRGSSKFIMLCGRFVRLRPSCWQSLMSWNIPGMPQ